MVSLVGLEKGQNHFEKLIERNTGNKAHLEKGMLRKCNVH